MPDPDRQAVPPSLGRRARGSLFRIARALALAYLGIVVLLYVLQGKLIFPGASSQGESQSMHWSGADSELVKLTTASGESIVAVFGRALDAEGVPLENARERPTIVFFYGNGTSLSRLPRVMTELRRTGANVLIPEYVGYGMSTGRPSEQGCNETAEAAWEWIKARSDVDQSKIIFGGWSLGAAVAVDLASHEKPAAMVLLSPFTSLVEMAQRLYPIVPVKLLLAHRFESIRKAPAIDCPVLILHGSVDELIPIEMGRRLGAAFPGSVEFREIAGADHNVLIDAPGTMAGIAALVKQVAGGAP